MSIRRSNSKSIPLPLEVGNDTVLDPEKITDIASHIRTCPGVQIDLLGSAFLYRSAERAGKKFKPAQGKGGGSGWGEEWVKGDWSEVLGELQRSQGEGTGRGRAGDGRSRIGGKKGKRNSTKRRRDYKGEEEEGEGTVAGVSLDATEKGPGATGRRKRSKSRRKDPPAGGSLQVHY